MFKGFFFLSYIDDEYVLHLQSVELKLDTVFDIFKNLKCSFCTCNFIEGNKYSHAFFATSHFHCSYFHKIGGEGGLQSFSSLLFLLLFLVLLM